MDHSKTAATPLLTHGNYSSLVLSHQYCPYFCVNDNFSRNLVSFLEVKLIKILSEDPFVPFAMAMLTMLMAWCQANCNSQ